MYKFRCNIECVAVVVLCSLVCFFPDNTHAACSWTQPDYKWWSIPSSWPSGVVPGNGADVVIPAGYKIVYDISTSGIVYNSITVSAGAQLLVDQNKDISLSAGYILVQSGATFNIGNSTCPYTYKATVTLYGLRSNTLSVNGFGNKAIIATGNVEFWGQPPQPTWTSVAATVMPGATSFTVRDDLVNWKVGDSIVIATTDYYVELSEVFTITAIAGRTIVVNKPVKYMHYGANNQYAEVGHLNRNIVIQGDNVTSNTESYGGHVLLSANATGKVWGVEFLRMGQKNVMGKYPFHYHVMGDQIGKGNFVSESSFHDNYQRCLTIHGTSGIIARNNVAYNITGHCYFFEEGSEVMNTLDHNLGITVTKAQLIPSDVQPSVFWVTNPNNTLINNAAVGGTFGYWYSLPATPLGTTASWTQFRPRNTVFGTFLNNVAHSNQINGFHLDEGPDANGVTGETMYYPSVDALATTLVPIRVTISNITSYKNRFYGIWTRGNPLTVDSCLLMDNAIGVNMPFGGNIVSNTIMVGETDNIGTPSFTPYFADYGRSRPFIWSLQFPIKGVEFYDINGNQYSVNNTFVNYTSNTNRSAGAVGVISGYYILPSNVLTKQSKLINSDPFTMDYNPYYYDATYDGPLRAVVQDIDGSLTGTYGNFIVSPTKMLTYSSNNACVRRPGFNGFYVCPRSEFGFMNVNIKNANVAGTNFNQSTATATFTPFGQPTVTDTVMGVNSRQTTRSAWGSNLPSRNAYTVSFNFPTPPKLSVTINSAFKGEWVILAFSYPNTANFTITRAYYKYPVSAVTSLAQVTQDSYYYDPINQYLYVMYMEEIPIVNAGGYPASFLGTNNIDISASCGNNCVVSGSRPIPNFVSGEDKYRSILKGCANANTYEGDAYMRYNPLTKRFTYVIYHNLTDAVSATIQDLNTGLVLDLNIANAPIRGAFDLSLLKLNQLWNGNWSIVITGANPSNSIRGVIGCLGSCSVPPMVSSFDACAKFNGELRIFNDSLNTAESGWTDWSYGRVRNLNYTADKICGSSSLQITYSSNDALNFHIGDCAPGTCNQAWQRPAVNISNWAYLQFNVKSQGAPFAFPLVVNSPFGSTQLTAKYIENWQIDNTWTKVKVPLSALGFKGTELLWGTIGIVMQGYLPAGVTVPMLFDEIKLVPAYTDPMNKPPVGSVKYFTGAQC